MKTNSTIQKLFIDETNQTKIQFFRYFFVGGFASSMDFLTLFLLTDKFHFNYLVSAPIAYTVGIIINYFISTFWIFRKSNISTKWIEFVLFLIIGLVGLCLNQLFMWFFTGFIGIYYLLSKIISTVLVYLWNFFARKWFLFGSK